jgi:hypothetical protein
MRTPQHGSCLACSIALLIAAIVAAAMFRAVSVHAPFVPEAPPQRALGDFDGDGRPDTAVIQDRFGVPRISVRLSGSATEFSLDAPVTSIVESDIDHDGDLDLVAATSNGDVLIWLNNGHGRFARKVHRREQGVTSDRIALAASPESMAIGLKIPLLPAPPRGDVIAVASDVRPSLARAAYDARFVILAPPRAPPVDIG